jgi:valyl-tRNA synthetase
MPPPNVTGVLHMGHALNNTLQDIVIRHRRMQGYEALWLPGTDHAGIATQAVVEKKIYTETKRTREDMGREAFLAEIWDWKRLHGDQILEQLKRLGCSCDWSRTKFTLDEDLSRAVRVAFVRLWEKGWIYRGARLVNWDCALQTAVSDDEIEYVSRKDKLYFLRYPIQGRQGAFVTVATTRPETMLGDTGVGVHPEDARYRELIGAKVVLPLVERPIPIVADESVEREFGTGAVKLTPGHDPADYERGARHKLPIVSVLNKDGTMSTEAGKFAGLPREKARTAVLAEMEALGLVEKIEDIVHNVAVSDRSKSSIEPLVSEQWFVSMKPLAVPAIEAVKTGRLRILPERWTKVYLDWLENVRDWCISRQLWWGHRIPVWYDEDATPVASVDELEIGSKHPRTGKPIVRQDDDVLDTWASSWLWPFATLGWPEKTEDLDKFYPTQFLATAREIIYLWVARMVMAGAEFLDHLPKEKRIPFEVCYINATVLDAQGRRMSKSLGNGIDPLEMIDRYGADAVRYSLVMLTREGQDVKLAEDRFELGQRFCNKIWNATRFVLGSVGEGPVPASFPDSAPLEDRWIRSRAAETIARVTEALEEYRFHDAAQEMYRFTWNDFCDWYLEAVKPRLATPTAPHRDAAIFTLLETLGITLRLLHPFLPFLTEELWQNLPQTQGLLINAPWPKADERARDREAEATFERVREVVSASRNIRSQMNVPPGLQLPLLVKTESAGSAESLERIRPLLLSLARANSLEAGPGVAKPPASASAILSGGTLFIPLGGVIDLNVERTRLGKESERLANLIEGTERKLSNESFVSRAKPEVVAAEREKLDSLRADMAKVQTAIQDLAE